MATKKTGKTKAKPSAAGRSKLNKAFERRRHPRFLLTREQFRDMRSGKVYPVYDLSLNGLSVKVDKPIWPTGTIVQGILNLHPDSIEISPRLVAYYGDRAALKVEVLSTYGRSVLERSLSPGRLGASLQLIREKLPVADFWFHGVCNTDLLIRLDHTGEVSHAEVFFSNYYCRLSKGEMLSTGWCQSIGPEHRDELFLADEPVTLESLGLYLDGKPDPDKANWAKNLLESSPLDARLKQPLIKMFENM